MSNLPGYPVVCFGEVLWDILPTGALPGGAPMNVAYHLQKLGIYTALITKVGKDNYGDELLNILNKSGVSTAFAAIDATPPTGIVHANTNDLHEVIYDIVYPSAWDFIQWNEQYETLVNKGEYFVFGSLASRDKVSKETLYKLLETANTKVLDINLRAPHFEQTVVEHLINQADILKMNLAELELIAKWYGDVKDIEDQVKLLQDKFTISTIIVTKGGDGAVINHQGDMHEHPGYKVKVTDTIGSGDAFLAGYLFKTMQQAPVEDALSFACGMGSFIATQQGACPDYSVEQVYQLIPSNNP